MENINIKINKSTRKVNLEKSVIGNDGENLQENLVFEFDDFVDGTARLEILKHGETASYIMLTKVNETYELPIRSVITKAGKLNMQLVITEGTDDEEIPIFKSNQFYVIVNSSINAEIEQPEDYPQWIDVANTKLNELDNLDIEVEKTNHTARITITKKDGTEEITNIFDGEDAKINGVNTLSLIAGDNITLTQSGNELEISATGGGGGGGGTTNYNSLSNKPKINDVELSGNKTTSDLGIVIPDVSDFITKDVDNLENYTKSSDLSNVATSGDYNDLINKPSGSDGDVFFVGKTSSTDPFLLEGKKKGLYLFDGNSPYRIYYKLKEDKQTSSFNYIPQFIYLTEDFVYNNIGTKIFGYMFTTRNGYLSMNSLSINQSWNYQIDVGNDTLFDTSILLTGGAQTFQGIKTFNSIPRQSNTNAPTRTDEFTNKKYVDDKLTTFSGYDATKTQILKNINGTLTWVDE